MFLDTVDEPGFEEPWNIITFGFIGEDGSESGGATCYSEDFFLQMWDNEKMDFKTPDYEAIDCNHYCSIAIPNKEIPELFKTPKGREKIAEAIMNCDSYITKVI